MFSVFENVDTHPNSMNNYEEPFLTPLGENINSLLDCEETINNNDISNGNNSTFIKNISNDNDFEEGNFIFQHNNSILEINNVNNLINSLANFTPNENSDNNTRSNAENIKKSDLKENSSIIISQSNDQANNAVNKPHIEKIFLITKQPRKKPNIFLIKKKRRKRKPKNGIRKKLRPYNINLKFQGIIIDSIFNYVNEKSKRFKFKKLKYEIKRKDYMELKHIKLKTIFENVSKKYSKDLEYNKKIIKKIYKEKDAELIKILELDYSYVYYHILNEKTELPELKEKYESLKKKILDKETQDYIQAYNNVSVQNAENIKKG